MTTVVGDYRLLEKVGAGGMGEVWRAENRHTKVECAVKLLPQEAASEHNFVARFFDEGRLMQTLDHPHIVKVHHVGHDSESGRYYLVMDYVAGGNGKSQSLHDLLREAPDKRLPERDVKRWAQQVARALAYAHAQGVIHRDIKPANVLIDGAGNARVTDFGLAKAIGEEYLQSQIHLSIAHSMAGGSINTMRTAGATTQVGRASPQPPQDESLPELSLGEEPTLDSDRQSGGRSSADALLGTYDYMAPEQRGDVAAAVSPASDVYAFGVMLYRLLTGRRPTGRVKAVGEVVKGLSKRWDTVIDRCLEHEPLERYRDGSALVAALEKNNLAEMRSARRGRGVWPRGDAEGAEGRKKRGVGYWGVGIGYLALGIGLVAAAYLSYHSHQTHQPERERQENIAAAEGATPVAVEGHEQVDVEASESEKVDAGEVVPYKIEAEGKWRSVALLAREPGLGSAIDRAREMLATAVRDFEAAEYGKALEAYTNTIAACDSLLSLGTVRKHALEEWESMKRTRRQAESRQAEQLAAAEWREGERLRAEGERQLNSSSFAEARQSWEAARTTYNSAEEVAFKAQEAANAKRKAEEEKQLAAEREAARLAAEKAAAVRERERQAEADRLAAMRVRSEPQAGEVQVVDLGGGVKLELVWCPAGSFMMGSPASEDGHDNDETQHRVTLTKGFWLGKYEVTQAQWEAVMGGNPSRFKGTRNPVESVSWDDCQEFVRKLNARVPGGGFRLPSEAEWEYACRAGTTTPFHYGNSLDADMANFDGNYPYGGGRKGEYRQRTLPVGSFRPNAWGLHDMHGNVWEWCQDWYGGYPSGNVTDPAGPASGACRVSRGGGWAYHGRFCRSANRYRDSPGFRYYNLGLRLARSPQ